MRIILVLVLAAAIAWLVWPAKGYHKRPETKGDTAHLQMHQLRKSIEVYTLSSKKLPDSLQTLTRASETKGEPFFEFESVPRDPWGNEFEYRKESSRKFRLRSFGEDGRRDTPDDIVWPEAEPPTDPVRKPALPSIANRVADALLKANNDTARLQMRGFANAVDMYRMSNKKLPDSLQTLTQTSERDPEPYLFKVPRDPWDTEYEYRQESATKYRIRSYGADGQPDTPDDLVWPEPE